MRNIVAESYNTWTLVTVLRWVSICLNPTGVLFQTFSLRRCHCGLIWPGLHSCRMWQQIQGTWPQGALSLSAPQSVCFSFSSSCVLSLQCKLGKVNRPLLFPLKVLFLLCSHIPLAFPPALTYILSILLTFFSDYSVKLFCVIFLNYTAKILFICS